MCRHIYDWNIVNCDVKQPIQQHQQIQPTAKAVESHIKKYKEASL